MRVLFVETKLSRSRPRTIVTRFHWAQTPILIKLLRIGIASVAWPIPAREKEREAMRLRNHLLLNGLGITGAGVLRTWFATLRIRGFAVEPRCNPLQGAVKGSYVFAIWHDSLLLPTYVFRNCGFHTLISQSDDGEYITRIVERMGWSVVRGSTSRGGASALLRMVDLANGPQSFCLGVTVDGPRGPRREVQLGGLYLAARTGMRVVPVGIAFDQPWHARSWDRFALPKPFHRATWIAGAPLDPPTNPDRDDIERFRDRVQTEMERVDAQAIALLHDSTTALPERVRRRAA